MLSRAGGGGDNTGRLVASLWLAGTTNSQLIVLINKSLLGFPMRLRGLSWNVHRGQLLSITRSSRPRKPRARCPPALACSAWRRAFLQACPRREGWLSGPSDVGRDRGGVGHGESSPAAPGILSTVAERAEECQE